MKTNEGIKGIACTNCGETVRIDAPAYDALDDVPGFVKGFLIICDGVVLAAYCEECGKDAHPSVTIVAGAGDDSMSPEVRRVLFQRWSYLTAFGPLRSIIMPNKVIIIMNDGERVEEEL